MKESKGRGSVSRSIRFHKKYEQDKEFRERVKQRQKIYKLRRKKKMNKRCLDCNKLINPEATRCRKCSIKRHRIEYLKRLYNLE
jgi:hypothetical protein